MISGDHLETSRQVAIQTGIITKAEAYQPGVCMTGEEFLQTIGGREGYEQIWNEEQQQYSVQFKNPKLFNSVKRTIRVIARATAEIKFILVSGIKQKGGLVAMTGDSISDA
jgi:magnesium-transporting ATPase (P-type)